MKIARKKESRLNLLSFKSILSFLSDDFLAIIVAAFAAYMMGHYRLMALGAENILRSSELPVCTTGITTSFGHFAFRCCHL